MYFLHFVESLFLGFLIYSPFSLTFPCLYPIILPWAVGYSHSHIARSWHLYYPGSICWLHSSLPIVTCCGTYDSWWCRVCLLGLKKTCGRMFMAEEGEWLVPLRSGSVVSMFKSGCKESRSGLLLACNIATKLYLFFLLFCWPFGGTIRLKP